MTGNVEQLVKLVSYGNEAIVSGNYNNFSTKDNIVFLIGEMKDRKIMAAQNADSWFKWLKKNNCRKLELGFKPGNSKYFEDYQMVGGKDTGIFYIEALYSDHSDYWVSKWEVVELGVSWSITYRRMNLNGLDQYAGSIDDIKKEFLKAIGGVKKVAAKTNTQGFLKTFEEAEKELGSINPTFEGYDSDLILRKNYSLEALQLIAAAAKAWVFGGMGNWSDNYYGKELDEEHHRVTKILFDAVCRALICGVNSFPE